MLPDPASFDLGVILTMAGGTIAAGLIAYLIQVVKRLPTFGAWLDDGKEIGASFVLSIVLVVYAALATGVQLTLISAFSVFIAWLGIAGLATKVHDVTPATFNAKLAGKTG